MDRHQRSLESRALGKTPADVGASASALAGTGRRLLSSSHSQPPPDIATKPASSSSPSSEDEDWEHMADDDQPCDVEGEQGHVSVNSSSSNDDEQGAVELTEDGTTVSQGRSKREAKKRKATGRQKQRSDCWKIFKVVTVPSKTKKGEIDTRAKCRFCYKLMSYRQGGATSHQTEFTFLGQQISMENINVESLYPSELGPGAMSAKDFLESGLVQLDKSIAERVEAASFK